MKEDEMDNERRGFLKTVASVSIATAFTGLAVATKAVAADPKVVAAPPQRIHRLMSKGKPPNAQKPDGSDLEEGDLAQIAAKLDEHPDAAVRAVMKQTAMGLASNEGARNQFGQDVHGALRKLNIDLPPGLLPKQLKVPPKVLQAASARKGWGIGGGHSNTNKWTNHQNHNNHSDYTDWW
jgi:hypothetical protein